MAESPLPGAENEEANVVPIQYNHLFLPFVNCSDTLKRAEFRGASYPSRIFFRLRNKGGFASRKTVSGHLKESVELADPATKTYFYSLFHALSPHLMSAFSVNKTCKTDAWFASQELWQNLLGLDFLNDSKSSDEPPYEIYFYKKYVFMTLFDSETESFKGKYDKEFFRFKIKTLNENNIFHILYGMHNGRHFFLTEAKIDSEYQTQQFKCVMLDRNSLTEEDENEFETFVKEKVQNIFKENKPPDIPVTFDRQFYDDNKEALENLNSQYEKNIFLIAKYCFFLKQGSKIATLPYWDSKMAISINFFFKTQDFYYPFKEIDGGMKRINYYYCLFLRFQKGSKDNRWAKVGPTVQPTRFKRYSDEEITYYNFNAIFNIGTIGKESPSYACQNPEGFFLRQKLIHTIFEIFENKTKNFKKQIFELNNIVLPGPFLGFDKITIRAEHVLNLIEKTIVNNQENLFFFAFLEIYFKHMTWAKPFYNPQTIQIENGFVRKKNVLLDILHSKKNFFTPKIYIERERVFFNKNFKAETFGSEENFDFFGVKKYDNFILNAQNAIKNFYDPTSEENWEQGNFFFIINFFLCFLENLTFSGSGQNIYITTQKKYLGSMIYLIFENIYLHQNDIFFKGW